MRTILATLAAAAVLCAAVASADTESDKRTVVRGYADIAQAMYGDSLRAARELQKAVDALIARPGPAAMSAARAAWRAARVPYMQSEAYRFGNPIVDEWEGKVNAWPVDEGLIDYVSPSYGSESADNPLYTANVIGNKTIRLGGETIDVSKITKQLLAARLHRIGQVESNVATGYHAIEFLLWGQDLNGTGPGAGDRPWTDYVTGARCTHGHCDRRARYLKVATDLLVDDLAWMAKQWTAGGKARTALESGTPDAGLSATLTGLGSLSYGELAGERMKLGLLLHDPEEEHDCFSDNTHNSHYFNIVGMRAVYLGAYQRSDGTTLKAPSLSALVARANPDLDREMRGKLDATFAAVAALKARAETKEAYDQMLAADNPEGNAVVQSVIDALTEQTRTIERIVAALGLQPIAIFRSDSLDDPAKVFK